VLLVTGACGFIGSNAVRWLLAERPEVVIVAFDAMTYAAHPESLAMASAGAPARVHFVRGDVRDAESLRAVLGGSARDGAGRRVPQPDAVWHLAAETHVDRSILDPALFVDTNVRGTLALLDVLRDVAPSVPLVHVGTDEVYGSLAPDAAPATEEHPLRPSSPYAASKAAADHLVQAYVRTYGLAASITRCANTYGPFQFPEKLIPLMATRAMAGEPLPLYGDGRQRRDWLYVDDHVAALWAVTVHGGRDGRVYNIAGSGERENRDVVAQVVATIGADPSLVTPVRDRPAHDRRYALDDARLRRETGWQGRVSFPEGLARTIAWYKDHAPWWRALHAEAHRASDVLYSPPHR
jgi:dTDP-glucose 4,6-dehydratase